MSIESALRELGKENQKDERFIALQTKVFISKSRKCSLNLLNISMYLKNAKKHHRIEFKNFKRIIRSFIQKLWQAKICKTILQPLLKWKKWHSISAV